MDKISYRAKALTQAGLARAERHGKREDNAPTINDTPPITWAPEALRKGRGVGKLDLRALHKEHTKGTKQNARAKNIALHAIIQFPISMAPTPENHRQMVLQAVKFVNDKFGGDAVFAARLDRDEEGINKVDVFFTPKYEKQYKNKPSQTWTSLTKHEKEMALDAKHRSEIIRRCFDGDESKYEASDKKTMPEIIGIAMQNEFREFYLQQNPQNTLAPKQEKQDLGTPDWIPADRFKMQRMKKQRDALAKVVTKAYSLVERNPSQMRQKFGAALYKTLGMALPFYAVQQQQRRQAEAAAEAQRASQRAAEAQEGVRDTQRSQEPPQEPSQTLRP